MSDVFASDDFTSSQTPPMSPPMSKVWLITGCSSGLGRHIMEAALEAGDIVIATARKLDSFEALKAQYPGHLHPMALDVTQTDQIESVLKAAWGLNQRIDILVNNAGYGLIGALEEYSETEIRQNFETNLFGPIHLMRLVLPYMREQGFGHIINISAIAGFANELGFSIYGGAKFALEGVSEALHGEVKSLGIKVTIIEPGPFRTDFIGRSLIETKTVLPEYEKTVGKFKQFLQSINGQQPGDPVKAARAIVNLTREAKPPLRLVLGKYAYTKFRQKISQLTRDLDAWEPVGLNTDF